MSLISVKQNPVDSFIFRADIRDAESAKHVLTTVGCGLLSHGVTSFCPTVVTSPSSTYHTVLPHIQPRQGTREVGANILGVHVEGPFISTEKKGAHMEKHIRDPVKGMESVRAMYGPGLVNVTIITLAPELPGAIEAVTSCVGAGITVSLGHTMAELAQGEEAVR